MGLNHSPSIVTTGLVAYFDLSSTKSYPGSGTTLFDLSGNNNNGTLVNGVGFDSANRCLQFDGTNDYVQFTSTRTKTVCFWGRFDIGIPTLAGLVCATATGDGSLRTENNSFRTPGDINDYQTGYTSQFMINGQNSLANSGGWFVIPEGRTLFQDFFVASNGDRDLSTISHVFYNRVYKGRLYNVSLYNRFLSASEMKQNFNALRGRYGL